MPAHLEVKEDDRVLHYTVSEPWTLNDMLELNRQARDVYEAANHKVHVLVNVSAVGNVPPGFVRARSNPDFTHPNAGYIAVVGASLLIRSMSDLILRLARFNRLTFFDTEDAAWAYLHKVMDSEKVSVK
jgi:hypothetical protein